MDKQYYKKQTENVLLNIEYYEKIVSTPHKEIIIKYSSSLKEHQSELTEKEYDYLIYFECQSVSMAIQKCIKYRK